MENRRLKNDIKKKYILSHEFKTIEDEAAKLQKETVYKQMVIGKLKGGVYPKPYFVYYPDCADIFYTSVFLYLFLFSYFFYFSYSFSTYEQKTGKNVSLLKNKSFAVFNLE